MIAHLKIDKGFTKVTKFQSNSLYNRQSAREKTLWHRRRPIRLVSARKQVRDHSD